METHLSSESKASVLGRPGRSDLVLVVDSGCTTSSRSSALMSSMCRICNCVEVDIVSFVKGKRSGRGIVVIVVVVLKRI